MVSSFGVNRISADRVAHLPRGQTSECGCSCLMSTTVRIVVIVSYSSGINAQESPRRHPTAQKLLDVAIAAIDSGGESALRLDAVVEQAGVAITAVYHHFGNREALMEAAQAERYIRTIWPTLVGLDEQLRQVSSRGELADVVISVLDRSIDPALSANRARRINVIGSTLGRPRLAAAVATEQGKVNSHMERLLRPFQLGGVIRADLNLAEYAGWIVGVILSRVMVEIDVDPTRGEKWNEMTRRAALYLLFGDGGILSAT
jgi:AcrR family transcriptional regulator